MYSMVMMVVMVMVIDLGTNNRGAGVFLGDLVTWQVVVVVVVGFGFLFRILVCKYLRSKVGQSFMVSSPLL